MVVSGWVHRHQLIVIEFLQAENRLLKAKLGGKRLRFTDAERALLARKAKPVGRKALLKLGTIVSPDTVLRWHRRFVAQKWNFAHRRGPGRPGIMRQISDLICRMAQDNAGWGYTRIQGALANLGHKVGRGTVANVLNRNGIEPAPERSKRTRWSTFLKAHWTVFAAGDFLTVEVWTGRGLVTYYRVVHDQSCRPGGGDSERDRSTRRRMDVTGGAKSYRFRQWCAKREALPDHGPRYPIHGAVSKAGARVRYAGAPAAADVTKLERIR